MKKIGSFSLLLFLGVLVVIVFFPTLLLAALLVGNMEVKPRLTLNCAYDDNITYNKENKKADYRQDLGLTLETQTQGRSYSLNLEGSILRRTYNKYSKFNYTTESASLRFSKELTPSSRLALNDDFVHTVDPASFEDEFGNTSGRTSYLRNTFNLQYSYDLSRRWNANFSFVNSLNDYSRKELIDSYYNLYSLESGYALSSRLIALGFYQFLGYHYENLGRVKSHRLALGLRCYFTDKFYLDARSGQDFITTLDKKDKNGDFSSFVLTNEINPTTRLALSISRYTAPTYYSANLFRSQRISLNWTSQILQRLTLGINTFWGNGRYTQSRVRENTVGLGTNLSYELNKDVKAYVNYSYTHKTAEFSSSEYRRNFILLGMRYEF